METFIFIAILLVFCFILGYRIGYKKGATVVLDHWKDWLNEIEEED